MAKKLIKEQITPEQALQFLEDFRLLQEQLNDEGTQMISIRVPKRLLRTVKFLAHESGKKYQSLMIDWIQQGLKATQNQK